DSGRSSSFASGALALLLCGLFQQFKNGGEEQGKHDLVVAGQTVPLASRLRRSLDDVHPRPVVPHEAHADVDQLVDAVARVTREVERLDEHLGNDHRGTEVDEHAAVQSATDTGEQAEVVHAGGTDRGAVGVGMHMDDVGTHGYVGGDGYAQTSA